mmetsp:Transcript_24713/g.56745  ORF Transcript_24713/g.56745 Transcript_24713/m.56745 type:complete len:435 (-) Transcript_24713:22-1326(-)
MRSKSARAAERCRPLSTSSCSVRWRRSERSFFSASSAPFAWRRRVISSSHARTLSCSDDRAFSFASCCLSHWAFSSRCASAVRCCCSVCCSASCNWATASDRSRRIRSSRSPHRTSAARCSAASICSLSRSTRTSMRAVRSTPHASAFRWCSVACSRSVSSACPCCETSAWAWVRSRTYSSCVCIHSRLSSRCCCSAVRRIESSWCAAPSRSWSSSTSRARPICVFSRDCLSSRSSSPFLRSASTSAWRSLRSAWASSLSCSRPSFCASHAFISPTCFCSPSKSRRISSADEARIACSADFSRTRRSRSLIMSDISSKSASSDARFAGSGDPVSRASRSERNCERLWSLWRSDATTARAVWIERSAYISEEDDLSGSCSSLCMERSRSRSPEKDTPVFGVARNALEPWNGEEPILAMSICKTKLCTSQGGAFVP